jgi:hypothetical protein
MDSDDDSSEDESDFSEMDLDSGSNETDSYSSADEGALLGVINAIYDDSL